MAKAPATRPSRPTASARSRTSGKPLPALVARTLGLLLPLGPVEPRRLFSGHGLYLEGVIFAITYHDRLYFRVEGESRAAFLKAGGEPFTYQGTHGVVELPYCTPPQAALASSARLLPWAERGLAAARRAAAAKARKAAAKRNSALGSGEVSRYRLARGRREDGGR